MLPKSSDKNHTRTRCPRERTAKLGACERVGCDHLTGLRSRICGCCLVQLGPSTIARVGLLRQYGTDAALHDAEEALLEVLNAMPKRVPLARGPRPRVSRGAR